MPLKRENNRWVLTCDLREQVVGTRKPPMALSGPLYFWIPPMAAPRQVQRDKWKPSKLVAKYRAWRDELRLLNQRECADVRDWKGLAMQFYIPAPKSWSRKRRLEMHGKPHESTPDLDNLVKAFIDAAYYNTGADDRIVSLMMAEKWWTAGSGAIVAWEILPVITRPVEPPSPPQDC